MSSNSGRTPEKRVDDVADLGRILEVSVDDGEQILDFARIDAHVLGSPLERNVRRADERKVALIGIDENHPLVAVLQKIGLVAVPELTRDDMTALDEPDATLGVAARPMQNVLDPRTRSVDDHLAGRGRAIGRRSRLRKSTRHCRLRVAPMSSDVLVNTAPPRLRRR